MLNQLLGKRFPAKCPVSEDVRDWVDRRLLWLVERLGEKSLLSGKIYCPTLEDFPEQYDASDAAIRSLFLQVKKYMGVTKPVRLRIVQDTGPTVEGRRAAGRYRGTVVAVSQDVTRSQFSAVALMAHELCHDKLERHLRGKRFDDSEELTDLATVYFGFGVFTAGAVVRKTSVGMRMLGYLTIPTLAYALGTVAWLRCEESPEWLCHLDATSKSIVRKTWRYLEMTGDTRLTDYRLESKQGSDQ